MPNEDICNIKESPQRLDAAKKATEAAGGKMTGFYYLTMEQSDIVTCTEMPNDEADNF